MREHCHVKQHRNLSATCLYCIAPVAPLLTPTYCTPTAEYARLQCELQPSQHGTTCCNAYIEAATTGLSPAMGTPSQIVVTAATAVAHTASMKSKQSRAPPAVGITCCPVDASTSAGTTACVVKLCAASLAACALCVRMCSCRVFSRKASQPQSHVARYPTRHGIQWRLLPACAGGARLAALSSPTVVSVSGSDDNKTAARKSHSQQWICR